jgi:hypothetical protein
MLGSRFAASGWRCASARDELPGTRTNMSTNHDDDTNTPNKPSVELWRPPTLTVMRGKARPPTKWLKRSIAAEINFDEEFTPDHELPVEVYLATVNGYDDGLDLSRELSRASSSTWMLWAHWLGENGAWLGVAVARPEVIAKLPSARRTGLWKPPIEYLSVAHLAAWCVKGQWPPLDTMEFASTGVSIVVGGPIVPRWGDYIEGLVECVATWPMCTACRRGVAGLGQHPGDIFCAGHHD